MPQLITIGETMAAFTPDSVGALRYVQNFGIRTAGAESNVAVGLAKLGLEAAWVSRLGTDEFGCFIRNQLRAEGVDCSRVIYDPDHRTGIMFKETGVGETKVFYYRENSAASHLCPEDVTPALLDGVKVLHMSGITPVLSESCLTIGFIFCRKEFFVWTLTIWFPSIRCWPSCATFRWKKPLITPRPPCRAVPPSLRWH